MLEMMIAVSSVCFLGLLGCWVVLAHFSPRFRWLGWMFNGSLGLYLLGFLGVSALSAFYQYKPLFAYAAQPTGLWLIVGIQLLCLLLSVLAIIPVTRKFCFRALPMKPDSAVHTVGLLLLIAWLGSFTITLLSWDVQVHHAVSGLTGAMAKDGGGITVNNLPFYMGLTFVLEAGLILLGVGLFYRRNWRECMQRLDIRKPQWRDAAIALGGTVLLLGFSLLLNNFLKSNLPESYQDTLRVSQAASEAFKGDHLVWTAMAVALCAGIGEELLFRGLLQPVYGIVPTWLLFVLLHAHYGTTFALVMIALLGLVFSLLKARYGTTTTMILHTTYDFSAIMLPTLLNFLHVTLK